jgi:6-phosphogluconolactonase/glucosamine-6-phosphate isomerase/deaminase
LIAAVATAAGRRAADRLAEDEARFIDFSRSRIFFVDEDVVIPSRISQQETR